MKRFVLLAVSVWIAGIALAGCGKDSVSPTASDTNPESQAIQAVMDETPDLAESETYLSPGETELADEYAPAGGFSTAEAIHPVFFFRVIREHVRDVHIETEKDTEWETARVRIEDRFAGSFNIVTVDSTDTGVVRDLVRKPLRDHGVARAVFRRPVGEDPAAVRHRGWRLAAVSNREIASPEHTARIVSVRLETESGLDVTITDPLELMRFPEGLPKVVAGERVRVTVQVADPTDRVFLLAGWGRLRLRPVSEGVYAGGFRAPYLLRLFRIGVNALDHGTLFDDVAPYDSDFWGLLARTAPPEVAAR